MERIDGKTSRRSTTEGFWLMTAVVLVALNLRPSMAAVGPLLTAIRTDIPLSFGTASLLTMLPVTAMGVAMFFGLRLARWVGEQRTMLFSLLAIGIATLARFWLDSAWQLVSTAVVAGMGIALVQALMPMLIKSRFSQSVALCMGVYVTSIMGGAALAASFSPLVWTQTGSWRAGMAVWAVLAVVALTVWCAQRPVFGQFSPVSNDGTEAFYRRPRAWLLGGFFGLGTEAFYRRPRAWLLGGFFGLGTAAYTCVLAWLAPYYVERGWSEQHAGLLLGLLTAMEVLSGLAAPAIANRSRDRRGVITGLLGLMLAGFCGLIVIPQTLSLLWPCLLGLGIGGLFPMSLIVSMDHVEGPRRAGELTAFVQGLGYLIAGMSPLFAGLIRDMTGSFEGAWWALVWVIAAMLLIVWRFDPAQYRRQMG